uniref:Cathepsin propeptide inhibitor domain-containing protein n=1 Tax=Clastoptera arizonana TaxID=38151 RepID=A0A1B6DC95_9HEMI
MLSLKYLWVFVLITGTCVFGDNYRELFNKFKEKYGEKYDNEEENEKRFNIFVDNVNKEKKTQNNVLVPEEQYNLSESEQEKLGQLKLRQNLEDNSSNSNLKYRSERSAEDHKFAKNVKQCQDKFRRQHHLSRGKGEEKKQAIYANICVMCVGAEYANKLLKEKKSINNIHNGNSNKEGKRLIKKFCV